MDQYHRPHNKKVSCGSGGRRRKARDKKLCHVGSTPVSTKVSNKDVREIRRIRGGRKAVRFKKASMVNVVTKEGIKKTEIIKVVKSHNPELVRMNVITKGAEIETKLGIVRVTNRPREGMINGVLIKQ